ncbi:hypothetical protein [Moorena producens]|uniref:hypothetical protein n=1 Tax=Moorena producens TaxID=1155739 RepID=UPI003C782470
MLKIKQWLSLFLAISMGIVLSLSLVLVEPAYAQEYIQKEYIDTTSYLPLEPGESKEIMPFGLYFLQNICASYQIPNRVTYLWEPTGKIDGISGMGNYTFKEVGPNNLITNISDNDCKLSVLHLCEDY